MWHYYKKSSPKEAKGGIKAQSKKGGFAQKWWAKRWISALETFNDAPRLSRGRAYARKGQVLAIEIGKGRVDATVQGSRTKPYKVTIETAMLSEESWKQVIELLATKAVYTAKLLAGEMPEDIESIFEKSGLSLLPSHHHELHTDCSCPDWSNPCKHLAAVFYLLGEEFDRDPFLIFRLRGVDRETFMDLLERGSAAVITQPARSVETASEPLQVDLQQFWEGTPLSEDFCAGDVIPPTKPANLIRSLGKFPFWRGKEDLANALSPIYSRASSQALDLAVEEELS